MGLKEVYEIYNKNMVYLISICKLRITHVYVMCRLRHVQPPLLPPPEPLLSAEHTAVGAGRWFQAPWVCSWPGCLT